jgi:hypothetical protein
MVDVTATVKKKVYHRHLNRSPADGQVSVPDIQVIPWAAPETTAKQFPAHCCMI